MEVFLEAAYAWYGDESFPRCPCRDPPSETSRIPWAMSSDRIMLGAPPLETSRNTHPPCDVAILPTENDLFGSLLKDPPQMCDRTEITHADGLMLPNQSRSATKF